MILLSTYLLLLISIFWVGIYFVLSLVLKFYGFQKYKKSFPILTTWTLVISGISILIISIFLFLLASIFSEHAAYFQKINDPNVPLGLEFFLPVHLSAPMVVFPALIYLFMKRFKKSGEKLRKAAFVSTAGAFLIIIGTRYVAGIFGFGSVYFEQESIKNVKSWNVAVVFRSYYKFNSPAAGDLFLFKWESLTSDYVIKRCVAVPGDVVETREGRLLVNGRRIEEPYIAQERLDFSRAAEKIENFGPVTVSKGEYFVLGDDRKHSLDSRHAGLIKSEWIKGKVWLISKMDSDGIKILDPNTTYVPR